MDYSSFTEKGVGGNTARCVWCGCVCAGKERGTVYDEAFPQQRCQTGLRSLFNGAAGSHVAVLTGVSVSVCVSCV